MTTDLDATASDRDHDAALAMIPRPGGEVVPRHYDAGDFDSAPDPFLVNRLRELPTWAAAPNPPATAVAAGEALDAACEVLALATDALLQISADQADEARQRDAAIEKAVLAGKSPTVRPGIDWAVEQQVRRVRHRVASQAAFSAQAALHAALREALPAWRATLTDQIAAERAEAVKAMHALSAARTQWQRSIEGAVGMTEAQTGRVTAMPMHVGQVIAAANEGHAALVAELADEHPGVTGAWLADDSGLVPSRIEREAMHETERGLTVLLEIEAEEGYAHTQFTLALARAQGRAAALMHRQTVAEFGSSW